MPRLKQFMIRLVGGAVVATQLLGGVALAAEDPRTQAMVAAAEPDTEPVYEKDAPDEADRWADDVPSTQHPADSGQPDPGDSDVLGDELPGIFVEADQDRPYEVIDDTALTSADSNVGGLSVRKCGLLSTEPPVWESQTNGLMDAFGDGTADDTVLVFFNGQWRMRLTPSAGEISEITLPDPGLAGAQTLGAIEIGNGGGDEFLAVVQTGSEAHLIGVFGVDENGCIFRYVYESGYGVVLPIRDTWELREGLICPDSLISVRAEHQGAGVFQGTNTQLVESAPGVAEWADGTSWEVDDEDQLQEIGLYCYHYFIRDNIDAY